MLLVSKFMRNLRSKGESKEHHLTFEATRVALILHKVNPELVQDVLSHMSAHNSDAVAKVLAKLSDGGEPNKDHCLRILARHLKVKLTGYMLEEKNLQERLLANLESHLRSDPARGAREFDIMLDRRARVSIGDVLRAEKESKERSRWIAILLNSLPEELAQDLLMRVELETADAVRRQADRALRVSEKERRKAVMRFLDLTEEQELPSLIQALESVCRTSPESSTKRLQEWDWKYAIARE